MYKAIIKTKIISSVGAQVNTSIKGVLKASINASAGIGGKYKKYPGPYIVTPTYNEQKLSTENLLMTDEVTIKPISVVYVENEADGLTAIIG